MNRLHRASIGGRRLTDQQSLPPAIPESAALNVKRAMLVPPRGRAAIPALVLEVGAEAGRRDEAIDPAHGLIPPLAASVDPLNPTVRVASGAMRHPVATRPAAVGRAGAVPPPCRATRSARPRRDSRPGRSRDTGSGGSVAGRGGSVTRRSRPSRHDNTIGCARNRAKPGATAPPLATCRSARVGTAHRSTRAHSPAAPARARLGAPPCPGMLVDWRARGRVRMATGRQVA